MPRARGQVDTTKRSATVEAAIAIIGETSSLAFAMGVVATRAGVSKQTIYNHYGSRAAFERAILADLLIDQTMSANRNRARRLFLARMAEGDAPAAAMHEMSSLIAGQPPAGPSSVSIEVHAYRASNKVAVLILGNGETEILGQADNTPEGIRDATAMAVRLSKITGRPWSDQRPQESDA